MDCCLQTSLLLKFILRLSGGNVQFVVSYEVLEHDGDTFESEKRQFKPSFSQHTSFCTLCLCFSPSMSRSCLFLHLFIPTLPFSSMSFSLIHYRSGITQ